MVLNVLEVKFMHRILVLIHCSLYSNLTANISIPVNAFLENFQFYNTCTFLQYLWKILLEPLTILRQHAVWKATPRGGH